MQVPTINYGFLTMSADEQRAYTESLSQFKGEARKSLSEGFSFDSDGTLKGSNSFLPVWLNQTGLLPRNEVLLSLAQFGRAFNSNPNAFVYTYRDTGIILRTNGDEIEKNNYLSKNLFGKLKKRGFIATPEKPIVISLTDFKKPRQNDNSGYGLVYDLTENAKPIVAPEYGTAESTTRFNIYDERGIPIPKKDGKYTIWKKDSGVSGVYSYFGRGAASSVWRIRAAAAG